MDKEKIIEICLNSNSMSEAAVKANISRSKLVTLAKQYGCYKPNRAGKGIRKEKKPTIPIEDIFNGLHFLVRWQLKRRLIKEGYKEDKCEKCGLFEWLGMPLSIQLHHKDGNGKNNHLENLELLCPNCHSQTDTFGGKKGKNKKLKK